MGLFDRFKKGRKEEPAQAEPAGDVPSGHLADALARCVGVARLRQLRFGQWLAGRPWNVDFSRGVILFGAEEFPVAFLGSQSDSAGTWLWGVDNLGDFPDAVVADVRAFFDTPLMLSLPELRQTTLPVGDLANGHMIASLFVAGGEGEPSCYYRCPYEGGAAFVAVKGLPEDIFAPAPATEIIRILSELISSAPLPHRALAQGMLDAHCTELLQDGETLRGRLADGTEITVSFDEQDRIASMNTVVTGGEADGGEGTDSGEETAGETADQEPNIEEPAEEENRDGETDAEGEIE